MALLELYKLSGTKIGLWYIPLSLSKILGLNLSHENTKKIGTPSNMAPNPIAMVTLSLGDSTNGSRTSTTDTSAINICTIIHTYMYAYR